jgi:hypothetical protein
MLDNGIIVSRLVLTAVPAEATIHDGKCRYQGHRHRSHWHQGRAYVTQKREHHEGYQDHSCDKRDFDLPERCPDRLRAINHEIDVECGRNRSSQLRHQFLHAVHHLDDVGAWLPVHDHHDRGFAIGEAEIAYIFHGIDDLADVGKANRRAFAVGNDQRLVILSFISLIVGINLIAPIFHVDATLGAVRIGATERAADIFQAYAILIERLRDQFDADGRQRSAADADLTYTLDLRKILGQHGRSAIIEFGGRQRI